MVLPHQSYSTASPNVGSTIPMNASHLRKNSPESLTAIKEEKPRCRICWEESENKPSPMPCGHFWCASCVVQAYNSIRNESQWPIRCSKVFGYSCYISFDAAIPSLPDKEIQRLTPLIEEFDSPKLGRTYCSNRRCGIFVPRKGAQDRIAHCQACQTNTCSDCKGLAHQTDDCPLPDHSEQQILMLSHDKDWQRCTQCGQMCEKSGGCSQMTCLCGYHFCYRCAGPYPNCNCQVEHNQRHDEARGEQTATSGSEPVDQRQARLRKEFVKFTTQRAKKRTGVDPDTLYPEILVPAEVSLELMLRRSQQDQAARMAQIQRDQAERARQQQSSSLTSRHLRAFMETRNRFRGS